MYFFLHIKYEYKYYVFCSYEASSYENGSVVVDYSASSYRLVEGALSIYDLDH